MNWANFVLKLPILIQGAVQVVEFVKGAKGSDKKAAVIAAIPQGIDLAEFAVGHDIINNATVASLISDYIDAEAAVLKARNALKDGILANQPAAGV